LGDLQATIRAYLRDDLGLDEAALTPDAELITTGLVDSVALVRLVTFVEDQAGITVPNRDITVEHFGSLDRIQRYVTSMLAG
jgi:acyl carrier protein